MLLKEFKNIVKKDENVVVVFSICIKHYNKARDRDLEFSLNNFHLILASFRNFEKFTLGVYWSNRQNLTILEMRNTLQYKHFKVTYYGYLQERAYCK